MFTKRQCQILAVLAGTDSWIPSKALSEAIGIGSRTIQTEIRKINEEIGHMKMPETARIQSNNRKGYRLSDPEGELRDVLYRSAWGDNSEDDKLLHSRRILALLLFEKDFIHIGTIADRLYFSRSTVNADLVQVKRIIQRTKGAELAVSMSKGIRLEAPENIKRFMCMKARLEDRGLMAEWKELKEALDKREEIYRRIGKIFIRYGYVVSGEVCMDFAKYLLIGVARSRMGFVEQMPEHLAAVSAMTREISDMLREEMGYEQTEAELQQTEGRIRELNLLHGELQIEESTGEGMDRFQQLVQEETGFCLRLDDKWKEAAGGHLQRMIRRIQSGRTNIGNYTKELARRYPLELHLLRTCLCTALGLDIPEAELGYMVPYLAEVVEEQREKLQILLVSDSSPGVVYQLTGKLRNGLGDGIGGILAIPRYVYEEDREKYWGKNQLRLTTEHDQLLAGTGFSYITPFVGQNLIRELRKKAEEMESLRRMEEETALRQHYLTGGYERAVEERMESLDSLLDNCGIVLKAGSGSVQSIGNNILSIISHDQSGQNHLRKITLKYPLPYRGKQITSVLYAHYGGEGDMIGFFGLVKTQLGQMH